MTVDRELELLRKIEALSCEVARLRTPSPALTRLIEAVERALSDIPCGSERGFLQAALTAIKLEHPDEQG
jgi:hypothetical protein